VNTEIEPIEERLTGRIMTFLEDAQDRAFSDYRNMHPFTANDPSSPVLVLQGNNGIDGNLAAEENTSIDVLETFYQAPPPQVHLDSAFTFPDVVLPSRNGRLNEFSDSGYVSNPSGSGLSQYAGSEMVPNNSTADRSQPSAEPVASDTAASGFCPTLFEEYHDSSMPTGEDQTNILPTFPNDLWPFSHDDLGLSDSWELSQLLLRID
jgi:hypothetical protein